MENSPIVGYHPAKHKRMASKNTADSMFTEYAENDSRVDSHSYLFTPESFNTIQNSLSRNGDTDLINNASNDKQIAKQSNQECTFTKNWQDTVKGYKSFIQQKIKQSSRLKKCSKLLNKLSKDKKQQIDQTFERLDQFKIFRKKYSGKEQKKASSSKAFQNGLSKMLSYQTIGFASTDKENQINLSNCSSFKQLQVKATKKLILSHNYELKRYNSSRNNYNVIKHSQGQLKSEDSRQKITQQLDFSKYVNSYLHQKIKLLRQSLQVKQYNTRKMNQHYTKMMQKINNEHEQNIRNLQQKHQYQTNNYLEQIQWLKSQLRQKKQLQRYCLNKNQQQLLLKSNNVLKQQLKISLENKAEQQIYIEEMLNQRKIIQQFEKKVALLVRENQMLRVKLNQCSHQNKNMAIYFQSVVKQDQLKESYSIINAQPCKSSRSLSKDEENLLSSFQASQYCILEMTNQKKNICQSTDSLMYSQEHSTGRKELSTQKKHMQMTEKKRDGTGLKLQQRNIYQEMNKSGMLL